MVTMVIMGIVQAALHLLCRRLGVSPGFFSTHGLYSARFLCPWNSPGKNTGVGAEGSGAGGVQTAKASRKQSSLSGKESAQGCIPQRLLGRPD